MNTALPSSRSLFGSKPVVPETKPDEVNEFRFIFANGDKVDKKTSLSLDNTIILAYADRLRAKKVSGFCAIFSRHNGEWQPVKKEIVTITLKCI